MSEYVPTPGPLPGEQYVPSNGTEGYSFLERWCGQCERDQSMRDGMPVDECDDNKLCPIIAASFVGTAVEWREIDGDTRCIAFVPAGSQIPPPRCERTRELFE